MHRYNRCSIWQFPFDRYGEFASIDKQVYILEMQILLCWEDRQGYGYHIETQIYIANFAIEPSLYTSRCWFLTTLGAFQGRDFADLQQCPFSLCFTIQPLSQKVPICHPVPLCTEALPTHSWPKTYQTQRQMIAAIKQRYCKGLPIARKGSNNYSISWNKR